jgi:hypothetical protein
MQIMPNQVKFLVGVFFLSKEKLNCMLDGVDGYVVPVLW